MKQLQSTIIAPCRHRGFTDITPEIKKRLRESGILTGLVSLFLKDVGCSLSVQENTNPETLQNMEILMTHAAPDDHEQHKSHASDIGDAHDHTRMALTNLSLTIPVQSGRLVLGPWQSVCLYEHHSHAKNRHVFFHLIGS